jgi:hypothetical protein
MLKRKWKEKQAWIDKPHRNDTRLFAPPHMASNIPQNRLRVLSLHTPSKTNFIFDLVKQKKCTQVSTWSIETAG